MEEFYRGKKVLITGADGFMGSHLTERLVGYGANVSVYIRNNEVKYLENIRTRLNEILIGEIEDSRTTELIIKNNPQIIFHLAVDGYVRNSIENPLKVNRTNLDGTLNVLEAARILKDKGLERLVFVSSCTVYGTHDEKVREDSELRPTTPYSASKAAGDMYCYSYSKTYNIPISIVRPFNFYGPRQSKDVIALFINKALKNEDITLEGGGKATRDFTYVEDMIEAFLLMGSHEKAVGEAVNFGTGNDTSIKELAEKVIKYTNSNSKIISTPERPGQDMRMCCDNSKAKELFNWYPKISIDEGLRLTIPYYKEK